MKTMLPPIIVSLLVAAPVAALADPLPWTLSGCAQSAGTTVTLQLCGDCPSFTSGKASFTAPVQGTVTMRLDWTVDGDNLYAVLVVDGPDDNPLTLLFTTSTGWCDSWPCSGTEPSIVAPLLAGQTLSLHLYDSNDGACYGGTTTCTFSEISFTPDVGFVAGPGALDGRLLADVSGTAGQKYFGHAVTQPGDLDGDGFADFVATASESVPPGRSVQACSGDTGALLFKKLLPPGLTLSELPIASPGDLDGDGIGEILVGNDSSSGSVTVLSGDGGVPLLTLPGLQMADWHGHAVAAAGDANLDGVPDLLVGSPKWNAGAKDNGAVRVHSGADGVVLLQCFGQIGDQLGMGLVSPGDVNGDGVPDIAAGAQGANTFGGDEGAVELRSGADGGLLASFPGPGSVPSGYGRYVAAPGDLDGDGVGDIATSSPLIYFKTTGQVRAWSGASHQMLFAHDGETLTQLGFSVAPAGDWDADGLGDLFAGAPYPGSGEVHVLAGRTGELLHVLTPGVPAVASLPPVSHFGMSIAAGGDVNGDGFTDFIIGASGSDAAGGLVDAGRLFVISGDPDAHLAPTLTGEGDLLAGSAMHVRLEQAPADSTVFLVAGATKLNAPFHGGLLVPQPAFVAPLATGPDGSTSVSTHWPDGVPGGASVWMQGWCPQPLALHGWVASNTLQIIQP